MNTDGRTQIHTIALTSVPTEELSLFIVASTVINTVAYF